MAWNLSSGLFDETVRGNVRSGNLNPNDGKSWNAGQNGYWWSSRGSSTRYDGVTTPSAYNLNFNATGVNPSNGPNNRYNGFSLRCLWYAAVRCRSFREIKTPQ